MEFNKNHKKFMLGALIGGTVGTAAALLLAPISGTQMRQKVASRVGKMSNARKTIRAAIAKPLAMAKPLMTTKRKRKRNTSRKTTIAVHRTVNRHKAAA